MKKSVRELMFLVAPSALIFGALIVFKPVLGSYSGGNAPLPLIVGTLIYLALSLCVPSFLLALFVFLCRMLDAVPPPFPKSSEDE